LTAAYRALRLGCGGHHLRRDALGVSGPDALDYLQGQCSQDVAALGVGEVADSLLLEPEGRMVALVRVTRSGPDAFVLDTDGGAGEAVAARLARFKLRSRVEVTPLGWAAVALRGPEAAAVANGAFDAGVDPLDSPTTAAEGGGGWLLPVAWGGTVGVDVLGPDPASSLPGSLVWCGEQAWEALRVEAGIPVMGRELDARTIPAETGLLERAVSFTKGCYTGQELVARMDARGNRAPRRLVGVVVDPSAAGLDPADLAGAEVVPAGGGDPVGRCTSAAWCPGLGGPAALGYVARSVAVPGPVALRVGGPTAGAAAAFPAEVRLLPLVQG
jgi:folate-binding protein YgfZ